MNIQEINDILLSKGLNELYLAIIESKKKPLSVCLFRNLSILTRIGDRLYDILNQCFIDLEKVNVINFDNITNSCNESTARLKLYTKEDIKSLKQEMVLLECDDGSCIDAYWESHKNQKEVEDLSSSLYNEMDSYSLK